MRLIHLPSPPYTGYNIILILSVSITNDITIKIQELDKIGNIDLSTFFTIVHNFATFTLSQIA